MRAQLLAAAILWALTVTSAFAMVVLRDDKGGKMEQYTARFQQMRNSGETVAIDGTCLSACTMVLGLVPLNRVCATPKAVLGFHAAWMYDNSGNRAAIASRPRHLLRPHPPAARPSIHTNHGLHTHIIT